MLLLFASTCGLQSLFIICMFAEEVMEMSTVICTEVEVSTQRKAPGVNVHLGEAEVFEWSGEGKGGLHGDVTQQV